MAAIGQAAGGGEAQGEGAQQANGNGNGNGNGAGGLDALMAQVGQLASGQEEMRQFLQGNPWQQAQQEQAPPENDFDLGFLFDDQQQQLTPEDESKQLADRFNQTLDAAMEQRFQSLIKPHIEQQENMRRELEAERLAGELPELATPEMAKLIAGQGGLAEQLAQQLGVPHLAAEPKLWRAAYMIHKATELANQQGTGQAGAASLESGSGAAPSQMTEADIVKRISGATDGLGAGVLDF